MVSVKEEIRSRVATRLFMTDRRRKDRVGAGSVGGDDLKQKCC